MLVALLLGVELIDELYSGVPSVGAADIQAGFGASYTLTAWTLLLGPGLVALVVEPVLFVLADRYPRKWFVCGGLFAMALAAFAAALAPNVIVLGAAIALAYLGSGSGVALAQATLVDARPLERERVLTRWALFGEIGDLLAPVAMAGLAALQLGWRTAYAAVGAVVFVWAVLLARRSFPADSGEDEEDEEPGVFEALGAAVQNRRLIFWLGATALCDLLDEIVVVFATMYLRDQLDAGSVARSVVIGAAVAGAIAGVLITDRLLARVAPLRLLLASSVACGLSYAAWLVVPDVWLSAFFFFVVGVTAAPMYPIASAQAYAALPGRSGTVNAAGHVFTPLVLAMPWVLGAIADHFGARAALALLLVQPLGLAAVTLYALKTAR